MTSHLESHATDCEDYDDDDHDWFRAFGNSLEDDDGETYQEDHRVATSKSSNCVAAMDDDLHSVIHRLRQPKANLAGVTPVVDDYQERTQIVIVNMGNMAQCRGSSGVLLGEAGAVDALLVTLLEVFDKIPRPTEAIEENDDRITATVDLAIACWGAVRDLACGLALNRSAVRTFQYANGSGGLQLLASYLKIYHEISWDTISGALHLRLLTNVIGALRNVTHSSPENCLMLHQCKVSEMLVWRVLYAEDNVTFMPDTSCKWREAAFRASATLINMAEKCPECAALCGRNRGLVQYLVDSWGGGHGPLVHIGMLAILRVAKCELPDDLYDKSWDIILNKEEERKRCAQRKEKERKERVLRRATRE